MSIAPQHESTPLEFAFPLRSHVFDRLKDGSMVLLEKGDHYEIYDAGVKSYGSCRALVQSSVTPIALGRDMRPFMDTEDLWNYVDEYDVAILDDSPVEIYVYDWITKAQGEMIFDVGVILKADANPEELPPNFLVKSYQAMRFASLVYIGPFPHQSNSGWEHIRWDERAAEKDLRYNEDIYRELYHHFDYEEFQHVTEIQISVD